MAKEKCECDECGCSKKENLKIYFCPRCKSTNVKYYFKFENLFGIIPRMKCYNCGFTSPIFPQLVNVKIVKKKKVNKSQIKRTYKIKKGGKR
jgi:hypothetical protein